MLSKLQYYEENAACLHRFAGFVRCRRAKNGIRALVEFGVEQRAVMRGWGCLR